MRNFIQIVENARRLTEGTIRESYSRFESRGRIFYICHRPREGGVLCEAHVVGNTFFDVSRKKIAHTFCTPEGEDRSSNGRDVVPYKSTVEIEYRRYGVYSAMLDHLESNGFIVHPADGSLGDSVLQTQTDDAKAFWSSRKASRRETHLVPVSKDEFHGVGEFNLYKSPPDKVGDMSVMAVDRPLGYHYPFMVLWQKTYADSVQKIGVSYLSNRGVRLFVMIDTTGSFADTYVDFPLVRGAREPIEYFYHNRRVASKVKASTDKALRSIFSALEKLGYRG